MLMAAGAMGMAVFDFFRGGIPHVGYGDVEMERDTGQRMIGVDRDGFVVQVRHADDPRAGGRFGLQKYWLEVVLAEAVRFELTEGLPLRGFSRPVP